MAQHTNVIEYCIAEWDVNAPVPTPTEHGATLQLTNHTKQLTTMPPIMKLPKQYTSVVVDASCSNISTVAGFSGHGFLSGCIGLTTIDLSVLSGVRVIGDNFLEGCTGLTKINLSPLSGITDVGDRFLFDCSMLTTIDLRPLSRIAVVGTGFLAGCSGLTTIDLSPLNGVTMVGNGFLSGCSGLATIDARPLSAVNQVPARSGVFHGCSCTVFVSKPQSMLIEYLSKCHHIKVSIVAEIVLTSLSWVTCLGSGGQGDVCLFVNRNDQSLLAVKSVPCTANSKALYEEYKKLVRLNHPNIVRVVEYVENFSLPGTREPHDCIVMEYAELGPISKLVVRKTVSVNDKPTQVTTIFPKFDRWLDVALQTLTGLQVLHDNCMHHNDLKPANILMTLEDGKIVYKLADLGFGNEFVDGHSARVLDGCCGTRGYMAPEVVERNTVSQASDMYSWACTMGYVATGKAPRTYEKDYPERGFTRKDLATEGTNIPFEVCDQLVRCFDLSSAMRPGINEMLDFLKKERK